ncbi:MAG TPA: type VI secretion system baseplate subunit TssK, partial [Fibrobacteria bacterium]|nr:type VI secretion system baseplate subunit TssK [Fibrobacteria bacterium]
MVLSPHHLQQSDLLADMGVTSRLQLLSPFYYGLASLEIDLDALSNGFLSLRECSGIFPDGTHFHYPRQDSQLEQRPFESHFSTQKETLGVYLAVPALGAGS